MDSGCTAQKSRNMMINQAHKAHDKLLQGSESLSDAFVAVAAGMEPAQSVLSSRGLFQSVVRRSVWVPSSRLETREFATPAGSAGTRNAYDFRNSDLGIAQWGPTTGTPMLAGRKRSATSAGPSCPNFWTPSLGSGFHFDEPVMDDRIPSPQPPILPSPMRVEPQRTIIQVPHIYKFIFPKAFVSTKPIYHAFSLFYYYSQRHPSDGDQPCIY